jgi:hypothetical protein
MLIGFVNFLVTLLSYLFNQYLTHYIDRLNILSNQIRYLARFQVLFDILNRKIVSVSLILGYSLLLILPSRPLRALRFVCPTPQNY